MATAVVTNLTQGITAEIVGDGITLEALVDGPPAVGITLGGMDPTSLSVVNVWRRADGSRTAVEGGRRRTIAGADYLVDYSVPLGRDVWYELEFLEGTLEPLVQSAGIRIDTDCGYLSDPSVPGSAVEIYPSGLPRGLASLAEGALQTFTYEASVNMFRVMESALPVALTSGRQAPTGVGIPLLVEDPGAAAMLRQLVQTSAVLLLRALPGWADGLDGACYLSFQSVPLEQLNNNRGGRLQRWNLTGDVVAAPGAGVVIPVTTYGDVQLVWATYGQAQNALQGLTYLDVQRDPYGAGGGAFSAMAEEA